MEELEFRQRLRETPYLSIDCGTGDASLLTATKVLEVLGSAVHLVMDVGAGLQQFEKLTKGKTRFSLADLCKVAGIDYSTGHFWVKEGILTPNIKPERGIRLQFGLAEVFAAGVLGTLKRKGISLTFSRSVAELFTAEIKRTASKRATSKRS